MRVIYEFNCEPESDDYYSLKVFQKADQMLSALNEISDYVRQLRKGYVEDTVDQIEDKISDIICESSIGDTE